MQLKTDIIVYVRETIFEKLSRDVVLNIAIFLILQQYVSVFLSKFSLSIAIHLFHLLTRKSFTQRYISPEKSHIVAVKTIQHLDHE